MFGQLPPIFGAKRRPLCDRGAAVLPGAVVLLGVVVFDPVAAPAAPAPAATTATVPRTDTTYLRLRIKILPSVLKTTKPSRRM